MDFGMPTFIEFNSLEKNCELCRRLGLKFIELNMNFPEYQMERLDVDQILGMKEKYGIYFTVHLQENFDVADVNPDIRRVWNETALKTIEFAKKIGAPVINVHLNHGIYITCLDKKLYIYDKRNEEYRKNLEIFRKNCENAVGSSGIKISIENTDGFLDFERNMLEVLLSSPAFSLTWDIGHSISSDEKDMEFLLSHVNKLAHFHVHDGTRSKNGGKCHQELGTGEVNMDSRLCLAKECGARCVIETKTVATLRKSVEWLKDRGKFN